MTEKPILDLDAPGLNIIRMHGVNWVIAKAVLWPAPARLTAGFQYNHLPRSIILDGVELFPAPSAEKAS